MTKTALRKKVHQYIDSAEENVLDVVYKMLKIYHDDDGNSLMSKEQKVELEKRADDYRKGNTKTFSWAEVQKKSRAKK